jgi:hypothetical protein
MRCRCHHPTRDRSPRALYCTPDTSSREPSFSVPSTVDGSGSWQAPDARLGASHSATTWPTGTIQAVGALDWPGLWRGRHVYEGTTGQWHGDGPVQCWRSIGVVSWLKGSCARLSSGKIRHVLARNQCGEGGECLAISNPSGAAPACRILPASEVMSTGERRTGCMTRGERESEWVAVHEGLWDLRQLLGRILGRRSFGPQAGCCCGWIPTYERWGCPCSSFSTKSKYNSA